MEREKESRKKLSNLLLMAVVVVFILSVVFFIYSVTNSKPEILEKKEIFATLWIGEPAGFDVNNTILTFGRLPPTTSAYRNINITNKYEFPIYAGFNVTGNISEFLVINAPVYLDVGEVKQVKVSTIQIPQDAVFGNYTGTFIISFKKA